MAMEGCPLTFVGGHATTGRCPLTFVEGHDSTGRCPLTFVEGHATMRNSFSIFMTKDLPSSEKRS